MPVESKELESFKELFGSELVDAQIALEVEAKGLAEERAKEILVKCAEEGNFDSTMVGSVLMSRLIPGIATRLAEWMAKASGKGKNHSAVKYFRQLPEINEKTKETRYEKLAYAGLKRTLSAIMARTTASPISLMFQIGKTIEEEVRFTNLLAALPAGMASAIRMGVAQRVEESYKRAYLKAIERHRGIEWIEWDAQARARVGEVILDVLVASGVVELETRETYRGGSVTMETFVIPSGAMRQAIGAYSDKLMQQSHLHLPTIIPPRGWGDLRDGGYYSEHASCSLFRIPSQTAPAVKKNFYAHLEDVELSRVIKAVEAMQNTAWQVNGKVLKVAKSVFSSAYSGMAGLPHYEEIPIPPDAPEGASEDEIKEIRKKKTLAHLANKRRVSQALRVTGSIAIAEKFKDHERIYFPHNFDYRGRIYPIPSFSPQGDDLTKGLLQFADAGPIGTEENLTLFKVHGANCYGHDKWTIEEKVKWVDEYSAEILEVAKDPLAAVSFWASDSVDSPFCFLAFCFDYAGYIEEGLSFKSRIVLAFDGSCSGIQHFSALLRDEVGGEAVNLVAGLPRRDIYQLVADKVNGAIEHYLKEGEGDEIVEIKTDEGETREHLKLGTRTLAQQWTLFGVGRSTVKRSVMTLAYGSKEYGFREQVEEDTIYPAIAKGDATFSAPRQAAAFMAKLIWESVQSTVVKAVEAMAFLQKLAAIISKSGHPVSWYTPDGMPVQQFYYKTASKRVQFLIAGQRRLFSIATGTEEIDPRKQRSGIAPNFIHSLDASHMRMTVNQCFDAGIRNFGMIHDSFGTSADNAVLMFKGVRAAMVDMYENSNPLVEFVERIKATLPEKLAAEIPALPQPGSLDLRGILDSEFAFT
ncbi:DNA-directed RNA polymerase [Chromobacterium haemolyticum]|uniref:DNA-directed RNA polymerase n=1 Tax=Chromobacterium TaxID=535 RepID=UPI004057B7DC